MATSGISVLTYTRDDIINAMFRKCGILSEGQTISAQMINDAAGDLNRMIKGWEADGVKLWTYQELALFLTPTDDDGNPKESYALGPSGDTCVDASTLESMTLSASNNAGDTTITVVNSSSVTSGMNIGILQTDNSMFWTTINGEPVGNVITLTAGFTIGAASGAPVYAYTSIAQRPMRISQARIQTSVNPTSEIEMEKLGRDDYFRIPNKSASGTPIQFYYNPTLVNGDLRIWPLPVDSSFICNLTAYRQLQIFNAAGDTFDGPDETIQALIWNLASETGSEYGLDAQTLARIDGKAAQWLEKIEQFDEQDASLFFQPDFR